jgi:hypothetical protein
VPGYAMHPLDFPRKALQPPYFASRSVIEKLLSVEVPVNDLIPWIDHFMLQLAIASGVEYKNLPLTVASDLDRYPENLPKAVRRVRCDGRCFIHSAKSPATWGPLVEAYAQYRGSHDVYVSSM